MIVRLIAETITPIVARSRILRIRGARGVISNRPYLDLEAPTYHRCRTTLIVKQSAQGLPINRRAHMGYLHVDFKVRRQKQAERKIQTFLQLQAVGQLTTWGYGKVHWILLKTYHAQKMGPQFPAPFRILKGLPPTLSPRERQLVMAALLHDVVDTPLHPSKLGCPVTIPNPYVQWLCEHHHSLQEHSAHPDLQLLQAADIRTSRYARLLPVPTRRRKMRLIDTHQLAHQLEQAAQCSVHRLYFAIYHSKELQHLTASKRHPTETLRNHLIGVANWTLYLLRIPQITLPTTSVARAGKSGGTPGPVEMEDRRTQNEP